MFTANQVSWAVSECVRQQTGPQEVQYLLAGLYYAQIERKVSQRPGLYQINTLASIIEPVKAADYRRTPAVFNQGEPALNAEHIPRQMTLLVDNMKHLLVDEFVKELLRIHPWADGNGRTASVVWNWMNDSLEDPKPLPYYFGELKEG